MSDINGYSLSRNWFDFCFENPELIKPNHTALYFFCIEHCNRLGWKRKFGLPTSMAKEAIGIRSYNTYIKTLNDLIEFGFITMVEKSKNQYSSNIIALSNFCKANDKALDKALIKHGTKQSESTEQSIGSIDKQETTNNEQSTDFWSRTVFYIEDYLKNKGMVEYVKKSYNLTDDKFTSLFNDFKGAYIGIPYTKEEFENKCAYFKNKIAKQFRESPLEETPEQKLKRKQEAANKFY